MWSQTFAQQGWIPSNPGQCLFLESFQSDTTLAVKVDFLFFSFFFSPIIINFKPRYLPELPEIERYERSFSFVKLIE